MSTLGPLEGSLRTGGVFHGIASYLADSNVDVFQWENVVTLQNKAVDKKNQKGNRTLKPVIGGLHLTLRGWHVDTCVATGQSTLW